MQNKVWYEIKVGTLQVVDVVEGDYIKVSPSRTSEAMPFSDLEFANKVAGQIGGLVQQARWVKFLDPVKTVAKDMEVPIPTEFEAPVSPKLHGRIDQDVDGPEEQEFKEYKSAAPWGYEPSGIGWHSEYSPKFDGKPIFAKVPIMLDGQQIAEQLAADEVKDQWEEMLQYIAPLVAIAELIDEAVEEKETDSDPECGCPACVARIALKRVGVKEAKIEELMKDEKQMVKIFPFMNMFPKVYPISNIGDHQE